MMSKQTHNTEQLLSVIQERALETARLRSKKGLIKEVKLYTHDDAMPLVTDGEIEQVRNYNYYKGYSSALLWVLDRAYSGLDT